MNKYNMNVLADAKEEYTKQLMSVLTPEIYIGIKSIYDAADTHCSKTRDKNILKKFQLLLSNIPSWDKTKIQNEYLRIVEKTKCDWIDDLIAAVFVSHTKVLSSIQIKKNNKSIPLNVPVGTFFLHKCYEQCARNFWRKSWLLNKDVSSIDMQRNMIDSENLINDSILETIRKLLPVKYILKEYIGSDYQDEETVDTIEKTTSATLKKNVRSLVREEINQAQHKSSNDDNYSSLEIPMDGSDIREGYNDLNQEDTARAHDNPSSDKLLSGNMEESASVIETPVEEDHSVAEPPAEVQPVVEDHSIVESQVEEQPLETTVEAIVEEPPVEVQVEEPPLVTPVEEPPVEEPPVEAIVEEPPVAPLVEEPPVAPPVEEPPVAPPVEEPPVAPPVEEPPVEAPVEEPPAEAPVEEPPVAPPVEEPPVAHPVEEPPAEAPVEEPPVEAPVEEPPIAPPVEEPPVEAPVEEPPVAPPVEEPPIAPPVEEPTVEDSVEEPTVEAPVEDTPPVEDKKIYSDITDYTSIDSVAKDLKQKASDAELKELAIGSNSDALRELQRDIKQNSINKSNDNASDEFSFFDGAVDYY